MTRVAVVGAGLAGLAATVDLAATGVEVDVFERSRLLGGKATSFVVDGVEVDSGQHVHLACCTELIGMVERLGLGDRLRLQERFEAVVLRRGSTPARLRAARLPAPLHLVASFARYHHLGWSARMQVAYALAAARRPSRAGETAAAWMRRHHQGVQAMSAFWEPFLVPALNASLERVDAGIALFTIRTAFLGGAGAARIGDCTVPLARVAEAAATRAARIHMRTTVVGVTGTPHRVDGVVTDAGPLPYDGVVLAVPPSRLARILGRPEDFGVDGLDRFAVEPIVDVHLWYDGAVEAPGFFAVLDSPVQWGFRKEADHLVCSMSAAGALVGRPEADLVALCHAELAAVLPSLVGRAPRRGAATRDPEATFVPTPGLRRPGNRTSAPNLTVAGAWTDTGWPATMESAVRSGREAARLLVPAPAPPLRTETTTPGAGAVAPPAAVGTVVAATASGGGRP